MAKDYICEVERVYYSTGFIRRCNIEQNFIPLVFASIDASFLNAVPKRVFETAYTRFPILPIFQYRGERDSMWAADVGVEIKMKPCPDSKVGDCKDYRPDHKRLSPILIMILIMIVLVDDIRKTAESAKENRFMREQKTIMGVSTWWRSPSNISELLVQWRYGEQMMEDQCFQPALRYCHVICFYYSCIWLTD